MSLLPAPIDPPADLEDRRLLPLFAYGTLLDQRLVQGLLEHPVADEPARLLDFARTELPGLGYPTLVAAPGASVEGLLYRGLSAEDYRRLDAYEGVAEGLYHRVCAEAAVGDGSGAVEPAFVYLATAKTRRRYGG